MPDFAGISNPTDLTSALTGSKHLFEDALSVVAKDDRVDVLVPVLVAPTVPAIENVIKLAETTAKPVAVLWTGYCPSDPAIVPATLVARGLPVYRDALTCLKAVRAAMTYGDFLRAHQAAAAKPVRPHGVDYMLVEKLLGAGAGALTERASKEVLAAYGLPVTRERLATSAAEAVQCAREIGGTVALKIESPDIPHKTEAGAIRLYVSGDAAVARAHDEVIAAARNFKPDAQLDGVLVQEMAPAGVEVMLGIASDPTFGVVVAAALGGIHVEVLRDVAYRIPPLAAADAHAMLRELRAFPIFAGVRGARARDLDALCDAIVRLSWLAHDHADKIGEVDLNPLTVLEAGAGVRVVDALIIRK
jgi:acetate---CoA ligase (ADP-forming)